jgi:DNA-binding response OmpR family regulator
MPARILVVDDSPTIRKVVAAILESEGYLTATAGDGIEALQVLAEESADLVLVDFVMPRMNGFQFCRELRIRDGLVGTPVVLMSAKGDKIRGQFLQQTGAIDAITKPFDARGLLAVVELALKKSLEAKTKGSSMPPPLVDEESGESSRPSSADLLADPAARRIQAATEFAAALTKVLGPALAAMPDEIGVANIGQGIYDAITPEALLSLTSLIKSLETTHGTRQVLSGDISVISVAEVLQLLELQRKTGTLLVATRGGEVSVVINDGAVGFARSRGLRDEFLLGRYLIASGILTRDTLESVVKNNSSQRPLGERMMELGLATETQVRTALERQTSELVYELVRWKTGRFAFEVGVPDESAYHVALHIPMTALVMEGFRRVDEWRLIEGTFDFDEVLYRDEIAIDRLGNHDLTEQERIVLDAIDGERTVREIVEDSKGNSFDLCKILYQFVNSRLVRRKAA